MTPEHGVYGELHELKTRIVALEAELQALRDEANAVALSGPITRKRTPKQET